MQTASTQRGDGPDPATRLRLVSLQMPAGPIELGGGLACVRTTPGLESETARAIAGAVIGPRSPDVDGTVEIAGRHVPLHILPAPLLGPNAASTVDGGLLDELWREACAELRSDVEAARLTELLAALDDLEPVPSAAARALADAFDELAARPPAPPELVDLDLAEIERRAGAARLAVAGAAGGYPPQAWVRIEACHRAAVQAERNLFEAGRKERPAALSRYQQALGDERTSLAEAGVESYASFLVAIAAGAAPVDLDGRLRAELELAQAETPRERAQVSHTAVPRDERAEREAELRRRAERLLGRPAGDDPQSELRALRLEHPDAAPTREQMYRVFAGAGIAVGGDVVAAARKATRQKRHAPAAAPIDLVEEEQSLRAEERELFEERAQHEAALADLDAQLAQLDRQRATPFSQLDLDAAMLSVTGLLDRYRAGKLFEGRLPVVFDGVLDDLQPIVALGLAHHLSHVTDVQVIVVTAQQRVAEALEAAGAPTVRWPTRERAGGTAPSRNLRLLRRRGA